MSLHSIPQPSISRPRIDMVFTYVDGSDPAYAARRTLWRNRASQKTTDTPIRYCGVGEITFAVRSVLKAMPWIGTIHIVSDGQHPAVDQGLIDSGRVHLVDHSQIIPAQYRPVYASTIIESFLHRIPGLSDIWLYDNDDFLHGQHIAPEEFCDHASDGSLRLKLRTVAAWIRVAIATASDHAPSFLPRANAYTAGIRNAAQLLHTVGGFPWNGIVFARHLTQVYRTQTARRLETLFAAELHAARLRRFRSTDQLSWSTLAYSAECRWYAAHQRRAWPIPRQKDELFVDFARFQTQAHALAAWQRVCQSHAKFLCLNNIPAAQADAFQAAMLARGLADAGMEN